MSLSLDMDDTMNYLVNITIIKPIIKKYLNKKLSQQSKKIVNQTYDYCFCILKSEISLNKKISNIIKYCSVFDNNIFNQLGNILINNQSDIILSNKKTLIITKNYSVTPQFKTCRIINLFEIKNMILPFKSNKFNLVILYNIMSFINNNQFLNLIKEIIRITSKPFNLIIKDINLYGVNNNIKKILKMLYNDDVNNDDNDYDFLYNLKIDKTFNEIKFIDAVFVDKVLINENFQKKKNSQQLFQYNEHVICIDSHIDILEYTNIYEKL